MGRAPCCDKANVRKGPWSPQEDSKLKGYIEKYGTGGNWIALPQKVGLKRCGKSCRLRWLNYLRPNIKHGRFSEEEDDIICSLYMNIGSRWSIIAAQLPGRSDNDIKNYWNTRLKKKVLFGNQKLDHQTRPLAATKRERDDVQSYATSDLDIRSPNIYQPWQAQHMNVIYGPGTITESKSSSEQATSQLKTQQIQLYQESFEQSSCLGELLQKPEGFVIDFRSNNNMTMISTSSTIQGSTDCINAATQIQQSAATYHYNSDSAGEAFYQTSATPILFYPSHMENYIKLENSYAALVENDNSLFFSPPISSEGGIYESECMNTFNLENNHLGDCGGSPELNDLILLYNDGSEVQQKEPCNYDYESINLF